MIRYRRILFILCVCILVLTAGCTSDADKNAAQAKAHIDSAREFIAQKKIQTAIIEYKNAVNLDQKNDIALFELAEAYILNRQINNAVRYYNLAAKTNPASVLPLLRLAQIYIQTDRLLEARNYISKVLEASPTSVEALHLLSGLQLKERDVQSAIETLNKAVSFDDKNTKTYVSLATLYLRTNAPDKAEQAYLSAISHDPSSRQAYTGLTRLYSLQNKWDKAEALLKQMLDTPGIKIYKYTDLAQFYQSSGQFDLAENYFQEAVRHAENRVEPLMNLALFYTRKGEKDKAIATMQNALDKQPENPLILTGLAQIYLQFNMVDEAQSLVEKVLTVDNDNTDALFQQGRVFMAQDDFKAALDNFDKVVSLNQLNAKAYYYRALCIAERGATDRPEQEIFRAAQGMLDNPEEFEQDQIKSNLMAAVTLDPKFLGARIKLLEIYILEKNPTKAKEQMGHIFKLSKPNTKIMTLLSGLRLLEGDKKRAEEILLTIIENKPRYIPAYIRLGLLYASTAQPDQALEYFQKAYDMAHEQTGIIKMMVNIYLSQKKYAQALDLVKTMADASEKSAAPFFDNLAGEIYLTAGQPQVAFDQFSKAARESPDFISPKMHMAKLLVAQKKKHKALAIYKEVEEHNPDFVPALIAIGFMYDLSGNINQAERYYRKVLERAPKHPDAANNLAFILSEKKGGTDEALKYADIARKRAPKNANVLDTMGWVYYQKGNNLNALSELEESLKLNPDAALTCFHYGMALYRNQAFEKARQYFRKALKIDPGFRDAATARTMLNENN